MKTIFRAIGNGILLFLAMLAIMASVNGCTQQERAKSFGGSMTIDLPENTKLINITWKEDNLWYLTREMGIDEEPETYVFSESSSYGLFEGTITIQEHKGE